jgi:hypothetical protein
MEAKHTGVTEGITARASDQLWRMFANLPEVAFVRPHKVSADCISRENQSAFNLRPLRALRKQLKWLRNALRWPVNTE